MPDSETSLMQIANHIITQHPLLAPQIENIAAVIQGKGFGAASIEHEVNACFQLLNRAPRLVIDIGGNIGDYTAELRRRGPDIEIHTFEPSVTNIQKLRQRFVNEEKVVILPFAVSDKAGAAVLYSNAPGSGLGSLTQRRLEHSHIDFSVEESVATIRFESYWRDSLQERVLDLVKMDIEGHELAALHGFGEAIHATRVLQFEFGGCNIDTRTYFQDFWYFFKERGFDIHRITPLGAQKIQDYSTLHEHFSTANYVAVNQKVLA